MNHTHFYSRTIQQDTQCNHMYDGLQSLYPEIRDEIAKETKAKNAMLIEAAEASVNKLSAPPLILFVKGIAAETADINKYAPICNQLTSHSNNPSTRKHSQEL